MFEIVAGERRWHAATAVSLERVPVTVRQLTDEQAIELQAIENLQREDLTAIDEAEKYRQLRDLYKGQGLSTEQAVERIKDRVGRSRAAIFGALKLLDLPETTQERVRAGEIPKSQAEELAKIKDPERVELVARAILKDENGGARREALPVRQVRELVEFEKIREKNLQAYNVKRAEAEANGWHILTAEESAAILDCHTNGHWWLKHGAGYVRDETTCQLAGANYKSYRQLWKKGEWPTVTLAQLKDGRPVEIYGERAADMAAKAGGKLNTNPETGRASTKTPEQREAEENLKIRQTTFDQLVERVVSAEEARPESPEVWRMIAKGLTHSTHHDTLRAVCKRRGLDHVDGYADAIEAAVEKMTMAETRALVSEMILTRFKPCPYSTGYSEQLQNAAPVFGLDLQAIETEVQTSGLHKAKRKKA
jgi:ParB/RepB/Spo0J family partition protein